MKKTPWDNTLSSRFSHQRTRVEESVSSNSIDRRDPAYHRRGVSKRGLLVSVGIETWLQFFIAIIVLYCLNSATRFSRDVLTLEAIFVKEELITEMRCVLRREIYLSYRWMCTESIQWSTREWRTKRSLLIEGWIESRKWIMIILFDFIFGEYTFML